MRFQQPQQRSAHMIAVAGGRHPTHAYWLQSAMSPNVVNKPINLPANWDELISEAEEVLG